MTPRLLMRGLVPILAGFSAWAVGFVLLYGINALGCAAGWHLMGGEPFTLQRLLLMVLFLATLASIALIWLAFRRSDGAGEGFVKTVARWSTVAAFAASVFTFVPVFALSTCI